MGVDGGGKKVSVTLLKRSAFDISIEMLQTGPINSCNEDVKLG